jgi:membrane protein YqaA with SNARE-associated domain
MEMWLNDIMQWLALPQHGLSTVFVVAFVSATLLPMGSEPAVFGLVKLNLDLFWPAILVATAGNTLGGMLSWWMGWGTQKVVDKVRGESAVRMRALAWLQAFKDAVAQAEAEFREAVGKDVATVVALGLEAYAH